MRVFLNPCCSYGAGLRRWRKIEGELEQRLGGFVLEVSDSAEEMEDRVRQALEDGETVLVAAGGDGTVNLLLNMVMRCAADHEQVSIGAVGLGSSNDFHKPFDRQAMIRGIPLRTNAAAAAPADVIRLDWQDTQGRSDTRYALINAGLGITAEANATFNAGGALMHRARRLSVELAILLAIIRVAAGWRNIPCTMEVDEMEMTGVALTNLGLIKNPHFAGRLCYDCDIEADDGDMSVNLCSGMTLFETARTLVHLYRRRFRGLPKTRTWRARRLTVSADRAFSLETDGEVVRVCRVAASIVPRAVRCCQ